MPSSPRKYGQQRPKKIPPHVSLALVRKAAGMTMDQLIVRMKQADADLQVNRGTISAIETGLRGPSEQMLAALCVAYGIPVGSIATDYLPRHRGEAADSDAA